MGIRLHSFAVGEMYHCYNRGADKRDVFEDASDFSYFLNGLCLYNKVGIHTKMRDCVENVAQDDLQKQDQSFVKIHAYCLNKNHFHLLLENLIDGGVSKFMQKVATSYVMYFNKKNDRSGALFQGKFKSVHIDTDEYLQHLGVYINLNNLVHGVTEKSKFRSSLCEYVRSCPELCDISLLGQEVGPDYESYAHAVLPSILARKELMKDLKYSEFID